MKYRPLEVEDCYRYAIDISKCYRDNKLIFDCQSTVKFRNVTDCIEFIKGYAEAADSMVLGIFDEDEVYLYGVVIFDNIRIAAGESIAQVHIVTAREIWGKRIKDIYTDILKNTLFSRLYCEIPQIAHNAIAMCKRLKFKKTGFIPKALPYVNANGEERMYDLNIFVWEKK